MATLDAGKSISRLSKHTVSFPALGPGPPPPKALSTPLAKGRGVDRAPCTR